MQKRQRILLAAAVLSLLVALSLALWPLLRHYDIGWDFARNLWGPAHLLLQGKSPYRIDVLFPGSQAVWFPAAIGFFFPLGWLDMHLAISLWLVGSIALILAILGWSVQGEPIPRPLFAIILLATALFPPTLSHLTLGQSSLLITFLFLLATRLVVQRRFLPAGLLLSLALIKPQLAVLAVPGLFVACLRTGRARGAALLTAGCVLGSACLTLPLWIGYPAWVPDFFRELRGNPSWYQPSLFAIFRFWLGRQGWVLPAALSGGLMVFNLWLWWKHPAEEVLPWSLGLTTIASFYVWTWDFVLFLPLIYRSLGRQTARLARALWGGGYLLCCGLMLWIRSFSGMRHDSYVWVPWLLFLLVLGSHALESRLSPAGRQPLLRPWPAGTEHTEKETP